MKKYYSFNLGLAVVYKNNKWGIINKKNETVVPFAYKNIKLYKDTTDKKKSHKYFDEYPSGGFYRIKKRRQVRLCFRTRCSFKATRLSMGR